MLCRCQRLVIFICITDLPLCAVHIVCNPFRPSLLRKLNAIRRTSDSWSDLTFSEIHRRVAWGTIGLLVGTAIDSCNHQSFTQGGRHLSIPNSRSNLWISECHSSQEPLSCFLGRPRGRIVISRPSAAPFDPTTAPRRTGSHAGPSDAGQPARLPSARCSPASPNAWDAPAARPTAMMRRRP